MSSIINFYQQKSAEFLHNKVSSDSATRIFSTAVGKALSAANNGATATKQTIEASADTAFNKLEEYFNTTIEEDTKETINQWAKYLGLTAMTVGTLYFTGALGALSKSSLTAASAAAITPYAGINADARRIVDVANAYAGGLSGREAMLKKRFTSILYPLLAALGQNAVGAAVAQAATTIAHDSGLGPEAEVYKQIVMLLREVYDELIDCQP